MKKFLLFAAISFLSVTSVFASGTINYGSRTGMQVTVVSEAGLDTSHAVIHTRHTREDAAAFCRDYAGEDPVTEKCIREELAVRLNDAIYADCPRGIFTDFYGDRFQYRGKNPLPGEVGPHYILLDLRTRQIAGGDTASGYAINMEIFRALCPRTAPPDEFQTPPDEHKSSSELDFPMREINECYAEHKRESLLPGTDADLRQCMREHGFDFCGHCNGGNCRLDRQGVHHPECYRLIGRVNEKGYPTDDGQKSSTENEWDDTIHRLIQKWASLNSSCRSPVLDERKCDEFKITESILTDNRCKIVTKYNLHWECPRFKDLPKGD